MLMQSTTRDYTKTEHLPITKTGGQAKQIVGFRPSDLVLFYNSTFFRYAGITGDTDLPQNTRQARIFKIIDYFITMA